MTHKLLLADASVNIQRIIGLTFANEDVEVTAVGDGQLAMDRLDLDPPDIVLSAIDLPKLDGYDLATYVKSSPKLAHIPVVLLTGAFEPIDQARATAAGSSDVLAKPFEPQMVINRVKELLGKKRQDGPEPYGAPQELGLEPEQPSLASKPTPAGRTAPAEGGQPVSLDDYFDQLDAAFSMLQPGASPAQQAQDEMDWAAAPAASAPVPTAPVAPVVSPKPVEPPRPVAAAPPPQPPPPAPRIEPLITPQPEPPPVVEKTWAAPPLVPPPPRQAISAPVASVAPKANPFANLSAAKAEAAVRPAAPAITDEIIEEVVARVLQRLSDKVVRETVTAIVSQTAERLVQEEIDRIKDVQ